MPSTDSKAVQQVDLFAELVLNYCYMMTTVKVAVVV